MFAVIFKAKVGAQDAQYAQTVALMRELAFNNYNCQDFIAVTEGEQEIALSYWHSLADIQNWHNDSQHKVAQALGREKWYREYTVEVVEIKDHPWFLGCQFHPEFTSKPVIGHPLFKAFVESIRDKK